ncbi:MAG: TetR/AcrR family transcriptional regulator [Acidimicrobiales bacterium]|nr:TetR/AcrR family transcriptional regulator [Acidimicrobiales bacterium]
MSDAARPLDDDALADAVDAAPSRRPSNRRELILAAAIDLFHERGYPATGVDDIGKAVDVSGPAIYRHFSSKEEILLEAIQMAADEVHEANENARVSGSGPMGVLEGYVRAYVRVALERSALISVWTSEARHLSSQRRSPMTRRLRAWSTEWSDELRSARPELTDADARVLVSGAIGLITTTATADLDADRLADRITAMAMATLAAPTP